LWETTIDTEVRSLLQVKVDHADSAEESFSTLIGDARSGYYDNSTK
jgi:DNA gyrase subunit B